MSFLVIIISITVMGFTSVTSSQERIIDEIGGNYADTLHVTIVNIDEQFKNDVFGLILSSNRSFVIDFITSSNTQSDFSVENNELSLKLQETSNFLESKFGYPIYENISVANSQGTVIASTAFFDDTFGDMPWWNTVVEDGIFVDDVIFDDNLQISTRDVMIRIDDNQGDFLGVLKTKMNLQHILLTLNDLKQTKKFQNSEISLVSKTGKIIFSTTPSKSGTFIPAVDGVAMLVGGGYFIRTGVLGTDSILHAYSKSALDDDFPSLDWTLVVKQDGSEILGPVIGLTNTILIISMTTILSAIVVANYVRTSISQPLIKLKNASSQIAAGDFNVQLDIQTDDEVGELANKFELMRDNVHFTNENLRELIKMRTTDLKTAMDNLKNNELWTDELMEFMSKKFPIPIQSIFKNIELIREKKISQQDALQLIEDTTSQLKMLSDDFIDLYNIEKNKTQYNMADVSINKIIYESVRFFEHNTSPNVKLESDLSDDVKIFADESRMKRVITNLLKNSLKFTTNGFVRIETALTFDKKNLEIKISDSRGKIDGELYELFDSLKKQPKLPDDPENDFGLIISKSIITEHAGDFEMMKGESGLIISIKLPIFEDK